MRLVPTYTYIYTRTHTYIYIHVKRKKSVEKREAFTRGERRFHKLRACKSRQVFPHGNRLGPPPSYPNARNFLISAGGENFFRRARRGICPVHTSWTALYSSPELGLAVVGTESSDSTSTRVEQISADNHLLS